MKRLLIWLTVLILWLGLADPVHCIVEPISEDAAMIYGVVSLHDEFKLRKFTENYKHKTLHLTINSLGGMTKQMQGMMYRIQELQRQGVKVITEVTGHAASAAAMLWMMGDERIIHKHSLLMFHQSYIADAFGRRVPEEQWTPDQKLGVAVSNEFMYQILKEKLGEKTALKLFNSEDVWLKGDNAYKMGIATKLLK